jgi:DNA-directed RNA polymerase subunit M
MSISFCPTCNGLLIPKDGKIICEVCGFSKLIEEGFLTAKEKIIIPEPKGEGVNLENNKFASYSNICKKCGYDKAQVLDMGIFYSDEDNLIMLKCGRCGFSERIGRKIN